MKKIFGLLLAAALLGVSCTKTIDKEVPRHEVNLLEIRIGGQMGTAVIERDSYKAQATIFIMESASFDYSAVPVEGIVVSYGASASVQKGKTLNFSNPERRAKITVTAPAGTSQDWWIYLEPYDAFFVGAWRIEQIRLCCNQHLAGVGEGSWESPLNGNEFGGFCIPEYDNRIIITMNEGVVNNKLSGTIENTPGADGQYGNFYGILSPYSREEPLDMNPRLRHLLPPGLAQWELDLTTNKMSITKDNITSTMTFSGEGSTRRFRFILPSAVNEPSLNGFYDNMWRSSHELYYEVYKMK